MTFLNPFVLIGLAAAAIPIIIHLLNLRKLKTIEFSTLQFLKELQKTKMRRVRIRQWLLLALRTLMIVALVVAFSRPALKGSLAGTIGMHAKTTMVVLVDDSPSMAVRTDRGVIFAGARETTERTLGLLKEGDEAYVIPVSDIRRRESFTSVRAADEARSMLEQLAPSHLSISYRDAIGVAAKILAESKNFNQEVYLIGDGQRTQFESQGDVPDTTDLFDDRVKVFSVEPASSQQKNAGIASVELLSRILTVNKPIMLRTVIRNFGPAAMKNALLSGYLDGMRVVQQSLDIAPDGSATATLSIIPKRRGVLEGYLQLEDDALELDNRRFFVLNIPESINILLAGSTPDDTKFLALALTPGSDTTVTSMFNVRTASEAQLSSIDINRFDAVILAGLKRFTPSEAERLSRYVKSGGGLILFPGKEPGVANYNETILSSLGIPPIREAVKLTDKPGDQAGSQSSFLTFGKVDYAHPLFAGLFEQSPAGRSSDPMIESPRVGSYVIPDAGKNGQTVISLSDGSGFLTEYAIGSGRVLLFSVEAGLSWSDFPVKGLFVPMIHRSTMYLGGQNQEAGSAIVGDGIQLTMRMDANAARDAFVIQSPGGIEEKIQPRFLSGSGLAVFDYPVTPEVGIYKLRRLRAGARETGSGELVDAVSVNIAASESDLKRISDEEMETFWARLGLKPEQVRRLPAVSSIDATILESRFGVELWKYFIGFALVLALAEMAIGREPKPERTASTGRATG